MLFVPALRLRTCMAPALLTAALLIGASTATLSAQAPSRAIDALQPVAQADRIAAHPDYAALTQLSNQLPGWVHASQSAARSVDLGTPVRVTLVLNRSAAAQSAFEQLLADQQNPASPLFHQWLTPQQVGKLFGPTANDLAALTSWLTSQGLKVESVSPSGVMISVSGTTALIGNAFHTTFAAFDLESESGSGRTRLSAVSEPSIPSALSPLVRSIQGLAEVPVHPMNHATALPDSLRAKSTKLSNPQPDLTVVNGGTTYHFISPNDFAKIYDIASVYTGGNTGAKIGSKTQRIAVIGESRVAATDISEYETNTGLPSVVPNVVVPTTGTDPGTTGNSLQDEATLDVDRVIGTAPGAAVDLVVAASTMTTGGIFIAAQYNVDTLLDPVMTISFGGCEASAGSADVDYIDSLASAGTTEGITTIVSSGDSGAAGCETSFVAVTGTQVASINFICSTTYVTCVGGTELNDTANTSTYWSSTNGTGYESALTYIPEGAWNEPSSVNSSNVTVYAPAASGGGESTFISKPTWQTGTGVPSGSFRYVPDVAFPAATHDGYYACLAYAGGDCSKGYFEDFSGTSAAAPGMAGVVALMNTKSGTALGNINPTLYSLAASAPSDFHDATVATSGVTGCTTATPSMCNNSTPSATGLTGGLAGFELTTGYDEVTGLGSIDVAKLLTGISGSSLTSTTLALTVAPTSIAAGQTSTLTATLTIPSTGTPTGTVQFYFNDVAVGSPVTISNNVATLSPTFTTVGSWPVTAVYSGDSTFATSTSPGVTLTVTAATVGTYSLAASPATLSATPTTSSTETPITGTVTSTITATSTNSFAGTVALSCSITPVTGTPPTCALSPASISLAANGTATSTLTITYVGPVTNCTNSALLRSGRPDTVLCGVALASLLLLILPFRKRRALRMLCLVCLIGAGSGSLTGCGGNSGTKACATVTTGSTTAGSYSVVVTGTSGSTVANANVNITVNAPAQ